MTDEFKLNKRQLYEIMNLFETHDPADFEEEPDMFEDITQEVFDGIDNQMGDLEMMCPQDFDFEETMSSFELMDAKMDLRLRGNLVMQNSKGILDFFASGEEMTQGQKFALMRELLLEFATWQDQVVNLQQSVYSCLYLTKKEFYLKNEDMCPFIEAMHYLIHLYNEGARGTIIFRDEDVVYPSNFEQMNELPLKDIIARLQERIDFYDNAPKSGNKAQDKQTKDFGKCFKMIQGLLVVALYVYKHQEFMLIFLPDKIEVPKEQPKEEPEDQKQEEESKGKKKKNKKKGTGEQKQKDYSIQLLARFIENISLKIFEDKQEQSKDRLWAKSVFDENVFHALPGLSNKKIFTHLNFKQSQVFYAQVYKHFKDLLNIGKLVSQKQINSYQLVEMMDNFQSEMPSGLSRQIFEKIMFADHDNTQTPITIEIAQEKPYRQYLFYGNKSFEIKIADFMKSEMEQQYAATKNYWDFVSFNEYMAKVGIMLRERLIMNLRNTNRNRRSYKRYMNDMNVMVTEGNVIDQEAADEEGVAMSFDRVICLSHSIQLYTMAQIDYQKKGFQLELFKIEDMPEYCKYLTFSWMMLGQNLLNFIRRHFIGEKMAQKLDYEHLPLIDWFVQKRTEMTDLQRYLIDWFEYAESVLFAFRGMFILCVALRKEDLIKDCITQYDDNEMTKNIRANIYNTRFAVYRKVQYPQYQTYEDYVEEIKVKYDKPPEVLYQSAKEWMQKSQERLKNILEYTPKELRNLHFFKDEQLNQLKTQIFTNVMLIAMIKLEKSQGTKFQVVLDMEKSTPTMPVFALKKQEKKVDLMKK